MIAIGLLIPIAILGGVIAGIVALARRNDVEPDDGLARRLVVGLLTFGMTVVVATGAFQLLDVVLASIDGSFTSGSGATARAISLLVVGVPAATLLWRYQLRWLAGPDERSIVWLLHLGLASLVFSIGTVVGIGNGLRFDALDSRGFLAFGAAWLAAWVFYEWLGGRHPGPLLAGLPHAIGTAVGLATAAGGAIAAITAAIDELVLTDSLTRSGGLGDLGDALIWALVGTAVWLWQRRGADPADPAAATVSIGLGVGGGALVGLGGVAGLIYLALAATTSPFDADGLGFSLAAAAVGLGLWRFHSGLIVGPAHRRIARHVVSGLALVALASSVGVLVDAGLGSLTPSFAERDSIDFVWASLAVLAVAAPTWWLVWRPDRQPDTDSSTPIRRTYLTLLAGIGGVSGAIALIVLVFEVVEGILDGMDVATIVDSSRAAIGFIAATALVTYYHYRLWRDGRPDVDEGEPMRLRRVTVVGPTGIGARLREDLGVIVTEWQSAGDGRVVSDEDLAEHLRGLDTTHAMVVAEERGYRVTRIGPDQP